MLHTPKRVRSPLAESRDNANGAVRREHVPTDRLDRATAQDGMSRRYTSFKAGAAAAELGVAEVLQRERTLEREQNADLPFFISERKEAAEI